MQASSSTASTQQLWGALTPDTVSATAKLANGRYFVSLPANAKGEQYFGFFLVEGNRIVNAVVDATRFVGGKVTTLVTLKGAETPLSTGVTVEPTNDDFYELIGGDISKLIAGQSGVLTLIENNFGYTSRDSINIVPATSGVFNDLGANKDVVRLLTHELANVALRARVAERAAEVGKLWTDLAKAGTATKNLFAGQVISFFTEDASAKAQFGSLPTALFSVRYDSSDNRVLAISSTSLTAQQDVTVTTSANVTLRLTFDGVDYEYVATYNVKPLVSWNQDVIAAANASTSVNVYYNSGIGFTENTKLSTLNNLRMIVGQESPVVPALPTSLGILNSGTTVNALTNYLSGVDIANAQWFIRYGTTTSNEITDLSELVAGTQTVTLKLTFDNLGTSSVEDDRFILRDYTVTVLTPAQALTAALVEAVPGIILNNGEATQSTGLKLPLKQTTSPIAGVSYVWTFGEGSAFVEYNSGTGAIDLVRMYSQQKVSATVTVSGASTSGNTRSFDFRIMPLTKSEVESRVATAISGKFSSGVIQYFDLGNSDLGVGSGIVTMSDFLNSGVSILGPDAAAATISYTLASSRANTVNLGSGVTDSGANVVYIDGETLAFGSGAQAFTGAMTVTVTGTVSVNMGSETATSSIKFDIVLFKNN